MHFSKFSNSDGPKIARDASIIQCGKGLDYEGVLSVCGRGDGSNSIQCTSSQKWVYKKCSGIKGSMYKVMKSFICRGCSNPVISTGHKSVDIGASANLEVVDKFCYLCDMLSVDGDADAAVEARI